MDGAEEIYISTQYVLIKSTTKKYLICLSPLHGRPAAAIKKQAEKGRACYSIFQLPHKQDPIKNRQSLLVNQGQKQWLKREKMHPAGACVINPKGLTINLRTVRLVTA